MPDKKLRVAILSMYRNQKSQGMLYLHSFLENQSGKYPLHWKVFATRKSDELPELNDYDIFISTGGPGDPHDGKGKDWEKHYFEFLDKIRMHNASGENPKFVFSICHSFQLLCRWLNIAEVVTRPASCFGIFPCRLEDAGKNDPLFGMLSPGFLAVENRNWQCIRPDHNKMAEQGIGILAKEMKAPAPGEEPALLALRISPYWVATQFHPETNPAEMKALFATTKKEDEVLENYGIAKLEEIRSMLEQQNPSLSDTFDTLLPEFFRKAAKEILK
jgi:GMP synthase-like glutamine amidotransferase